MNTRSFELSVTVPTGDGRFTRIREYGHNGYTYVEGRRGQQFRLLFRNNAACRVLAVPSVDGICAVDGKPATDTSPGYVVPAYGQVEIKGWRTSLEDVAAFIFESKEQSYAAKGPVADTRNCGVLGVKVFGERPALTIYKSLEHEYNEHQHHRHHHHHHHHHHHDWPYHPVPVYPQHIWMTTSMGGALHTDSDNPVVYLNMLASGEPSAASNQPSNALNPNPAVTNVAGQVQLVESNLGAGWGGQQQDHVSATSFDRADELAVLLVYYSDEKGLRAAGIDVGKNVYLGIAPSMPQAFGGFCQPPPALTGGQAGSV